MLSKIDRNNRYGHLRALPLLLQELESFLAPILPMSQKGSFLQVSGLTEKYLRAYSEGNWKVILLAFWERKQQGRQPEVIANCWTKKAEKRESPAFLVRSQECKQTQQYMSASNCLGWRLSSKSKKTQYQANRFSISQMS